MPKNSLHSSLSDLLSLVSQTKAAAAVGKTTHPSGSVDDGTQAATTGASKREQESDLRKNVGQDNVEDATEPSPTGDGQQPLQPNTGTKQYTAGGNPAVEDAYGDGKDDPGTSHPADTENSSVGASKYASLSTDALLTQFDNVADSILASLVNDPDTLSKQAAATAAAATSTAPAADAYRAGYEKAAALHMSPEVATQAVQSCVADYIAAGVNDAILLASHMKQAAAGGESESHESEAAEESGAGGASAGAGGAAAAGGPPAGGDPTGGAGPVAGPGADPGVGPVAGMGEGDDLAAIVQQMPPELQQELLTALVSAMDEQGISEQDLANAPAAGGDPVAGGAPMPGGDAAAGMPPGVKLAAMVRRARRNGTQWVKAATPAQQQLRDGMTAYLRDLCGASA